MDNQAEYLVSSREQAHDLPKEVDSMVRAWSAGDAQWFANQLQSELGQDPRLYQAVWWRGNRKWLPKSKPCSTTTGTTGDRRHRPSGRSGSVIDLLKKDGIGATQR